MRNGQDGANAAREPLRLALDATEGRKDLLRIEVLHLVERPLSEGDGEHGAHVPALERLRLRHICLDEGEWHGRVALVAGIQPPPVGIADERIEEHRLRLGVADAGGRELVGEARRGGHDVAEVRGVPPLVEERLEPPQAASDLRR